MCGRLKILAWWKDREEHGAGLVDGLSIDLFHPQLGNDVILVTGHDVIIGLLRLRFGGHTPAAARC